MKVLLISPLDPKVHRQNIDFNENFPVGSVFYARYPETEDYDLYPIQEKEYAPVFYLSTDQEVIGDDFIVYKRERKHFKVLK